MKNQSRLVEKFTLGVAYLNLCAASIDYQSTLFCMPIIYMFVTRVKTGKAPKTWHNGCRLLIVLLLLIGYFAPYPDFAQLRNRKSKLCAYTERQTYQLTEISMQHHLITRYACKLLQIKDTRLKRDDITKIKCVHDSCEKRNKYQTQGIVSGYY